MLLQSSNNSIDWLDYSEELHFEKEDLHVFKIHLDVYHKIKNDLAAVLTGRELEKKQKFFKSDDARRFALGKYFSRKLLAQKLNVSPHSIIFLFTDANKPYLQGINFNISHSGNYVVIAISNQSIGIDVEKIKSDFDHAELAKVCFTINERKQISDLQDFYTFWTRKEAILKASGEGLIDDLLEIECTLASVKRHEDTFRLRSYLIDENHILSLAYDENVKGITFYNIDK
ncbi:4'-phosphopantetheinyl transferase family protein [Pedobacter agri]|uniref:4'-phosphopantetheinyl transferase family protein n=1 Tax=Pedobacter agri TaxID=454586 RepID=UPI0027822A52|nr:4'-phosphopantetheinyl transferase superfamily protein [Pedobacter agri]MDQ1141184.1 4'-phosphopantetheinyl transferase [Pedobacter agri]